MADDGRGARVPGYAANASVAPGGSLDVHVPDPIIRATDRGGEGAERDAMLADSVGLALLVVLEQLEPADGWRSCSTICLR